MVKIKMIEIDSETGTLTSQNSNSTVRGVRMLKDEILTKAIGLQ